MAVDVGDHASGFRHTEVISFINDEVLANGGGPDFYMAFQSRPWNEVEDHLRTILADPEVPRDTKRACTWSALALSVRVGARQREQQAHQVQRLQSQIEERETAAWALASELQRLRVEHKEMAAQLQCTWADLQQALNERNVLRGQVFQEDKMTRAGQPPPGVMSESGAEQCGATAWPVGVEEQGETMARGAQAMQGSEVHVADPAAVLYVQEPWSSWDQTVQPSLPVQLPQPFPFYAPVPVGLPYSTSPPLSVVVEADQAVAAPAQVPQMGTYPPSTWPAVGAQEQTQENSETLQAGYPQEDSRSHSKEENPVYPQGMTSLEETRNHSQKKDLERSQGTAPLGNRSYSPKKYPLENIKSHSQEGPEMPQETSPLGSSRSSSVRRSPKKQQPQKQKAKQRKGKKASDSQQQKSASQWSPKNWDCPSCKAMNFSWRKACYKCKKVCVAVKTGDLDPGQTH